MYEYHQGDSAVLINVPHCGTCLPEALADAMTEEARQLSDTDWHVDRLYGFAKRLGATVLSARMSRYVIDLNRPPDDEALYQGLGGTGLCPTETFDGDPIYLDGCAADRTNRLSEYWQPYHDKLSKTVAAIRGRTRVCCVARCTLHPLGRAKAV